MVPILILPLLHYIYGQLNLFDLRLRFPIKGTIYRIYNSELEEKCSCLLWDIIVPSHGFFQPLEPFKSTILYPIRRYMHIPGQEYRQPGLPPCCHSLKSYDAGLEKKLHFHCVICVWRKPGVAILGTRANGTIDAGPNFL